MGEEESYAAVAAFDKISQLAHLHDDWKGFSYIEISYIKSHSH